MVIRNDEPDLRSGLYHDFRLDAGQNDRDSLSWDAQNSPGDVCCSPKNCIFGRNAGSRPTPFQPQTGPSVPTVDDELNNLDDGVRRLKIEYDVYFGGGSKKPPADLEWRVQSLIKKYADGRSMNYAQRFRYNTITQKYALFNNLWQKKLRVKEEGYRRPQDALLAIQGVRQVEDKAGRKGKSGAGEFRIQCSDPETEKDKVRALFEAMVEAKKRAGEKPNAAGSFESFQSFVKKKTEQIRKDQKCSSIEYSVEVEKGQVKLKAKASAK